MDLVETIERNARLSRPLQVDGLETYVCLGCGRKRLTEGPSPDTDCECGRAWWLLQECLTKGDT
jgi:hypothetical protein